MSVPTFLCCFVMNYYVTKDDDDHDNNHLAKYQCSFPSPIFPGLMSMLILHKAFYYYYLETNEESQRFTYFRRLACVCFYMYYFSACKREAERDPRNITRIRPYAFCLLSPHHQVLVNYHHHHYYYYLFHNHFLGNLFSFTSSHHHHSFFQLHTLKCSTRSNSCFLLKS